MAGSPLPRRIESGLPSTLDTLHSTARIDPGIQCPQAGLHSTRNPEHIRRLPLVGLRLTQKTGNGPRSILDGLLLVILLSGVGKQWTQGILPLTPKIEFGQPSIVAGLPLIQKIDTIKILTPAGSHSPQNPEVTQRCRADILLSRQKTELLIRSILVILLSSPRIETTTR